MGPLSLMRRRPNLPHTFAYSTIGPAGLNFRVRDGNGWYPRGKITANLAMRGIDQVLPVFPRAKGPSQQEGPKIISKEAVSVQHTAREGSIRLIAICQLLR